MHNYRYRGSSEQAGVMYALYPVGRVPVVPGQTLSDMRVSVNFRSATMRATLRAPALVGLYAFYVPTRLVWPQFVDFLTNDAVAPLTTTTPAPLFFENGAGTMSPVFRRAFKLAHNQFFGDETFSSSFYANPLLDTEVTLRRVRNFEQLTKATKLTVDEDTGKYLAPVVATNAEITFQDFREQMSKSNLRNRIVAGGEKYVDVMRTFGVRLDWRVQEAPEFLGGFVKTIEPREVTQSSGVDSGLPGGAYYASNFDLTVKGKRFAEHGHVVIAMAYRPQIAIIDAATKAPDAMHLAVRDGWFFPLKDPGYQPSIALRGATQVGVQPYFAHYVNGVHLVQSGVDPVIRPVMPVAADTIENTIYPTGVTALQQLGLAGQQFVAYTSYELNGQTPVQQTI